MSTQKTKQTIKQELRQNLKHFNYEYEEVVKELIQQKEIDNPDVLAKYYDYEIDKLLETAEDKQQFCVKLIKEINKAFQKHIQTNQQLALQALKENILGKLFLFSWQDRKYLVIKDLTPSEQKKQILAELDIVRSSEDRAILYLDMLEQGAHRNFINGIISYLY